MTENDDKKKDPLLVQPFKWVGKTLVTGVLGAVLVSGIAFYATGWSPERIWDRMKWSIDNRELTGQPTCDDPGWLRPVEIVSANAFYLPDPDSHPVEQTFDGNKSTAWLQEWPKSPDDSRIAWVFKKPSTVKLVCLIAGWSRDTATYKTTGRPKKIKLSSEVCDEETVKLPNEVSPTAGVQGGAWTAFSIQYECKASLVRLNIESIYPLVEEGETQQIYVAISDIAFYG